MNPRSRALWVATAVIAAAAGADLGASPPGSSPSSAARPGSAPVAHASLQGGAPAASLAASKEARTAIRPEQGRIGDRFALFVAAEPPSSGTAVESDAIAPGAKLGSFRILEADRTKPGELTLTLTPETTGDLEIPAFDVAFGPPAGPAPGPAASTPPPARSAFHVPATHVKVASVLPSPDTALADLKPPADLPVPWPWRTIGLAAAGVVAAALALFLLRRFLKRPRQPVPEPEQRLEPGMTADAWARAALEALLAKGHYPAGRIREFHIELADLVRTYLELRFRIPALERTTEEVTDEIRRALLPEEVARSTHEALSRCDAVKFAKHRPEPAQAEATVEIVRRIIAMTVPVASPAAAAPPPPAAPSTQAAESAA